MLCVAAQRLGLVEKPTPLLTETQWDAVRIASSERGDSLQPCPICQDEFKMKSQVRLFFHAIFKLYRILTDSCTIE